MKGFRSCLKVTSFSEFAKFELSGSLTTSFINVPKSFMNVPDVIYERP
jgi:hypothetical protein